MTTVLTETGEVTVPAAEGLWLTAADARRATGWELKPEGMCEGAVCVPLPAGLTREDRVDVAGFWRHLGRPVVQDATSETYVLGAGADERNAALTGTTAPDFTLPDLAGTPHRLAELRGKKVFLSTWASW